MVYTVFWAVKLDDTVKKAPADSRETERPDKPQELEAGIRYVDKTIFSLSLQTKNLRLT